MSAKKIMSNADIIRLLELYRLEFNNEVPKSQDQLEALKRIAKAMNIPGLGPKQIAVKFNNLKKVYLQELKKVEASKASGADALSVYVPSLYWFPTMQAILSSGTLNQASSTFIPEEDDHSLGDLGSMNKNDNDGNSDSQDGQLDDGTGKNASFHVRGGKTSPIPVEQSAQESMELKLPDMPDRPGGVMADTLDHFGKYVASILRELPYDRSYNLQQKFINEAIAARLVYEEQHPTEFPEKDKDHETQAPSVTQEADPISKITANPEDKTSPVDSPAGKHRKRRKKSHSPIPTSSSDTVTSMAIKEEVPDNIEETENPDLPMSEQDNSRTDDSYSYMEIGEEMKLEYNGSSFETVYCESETSQMILVNAFNLHNAYNVDNKLPLYDSRELLPPKEAPPVQTPPGRNSHSVHRVMKNEETDGKGGAKRKRCRSCFSEGKRKQTTYVCSACPGKPGLCEVGHCFEKFHENVK